MCGDKYDHASAPIGFIPIKDYFDALMRMTQRAVDMARADMERRMDGFPDQFVKKGDTIEILSKLTAKIEWLEAAANKMEGKASVKSLEMIRWVSLTGIILGVVGIVLRFLKV